MDPCGFIGLYFIHFKDYMIWHCKSKLQFIYPFPIDGHLAFFLVFSYCKHCCNKQLCLSFLRVMCGIFLGWTPKPIIVWLFPVLLDAAWLLSKMTVPISTSSTGRISFLPAISNTQYCQTCIILLVQWECCFSLHLHGCLICICLFISEVEHLSICLLAFIFKLRLLRDHTVSSRTGTLSHTSWKIPFKLNAFKTEFILFLPKPAFPILLFVSVNPLGSSLSLQAH